MDSLCLDFLNSEWRDWRGNGKSEDHLTRPGWPERLLARWNRELDANAGPADLEELLGLRSVMRTAVESIAGGRGLPPETLRELNRVLEQAPVIRQVMESPPTVALTTRPARRDWAWGKAELAASFVQLLQTGEWRRVKICENQACQWIFYDESRNRARRWCDDKACGNLLKVRRFRARRKENAGTELPQGSHE